MSGKKKVSVAVWCTDEGVTRGLWVDHQYLKHKNCLFVPAIVRTGTKSTTGKPIALALSDAEAIKLAMQLLYRVPLVSLSQEEIEGLEYVVKLAQQYKTQTQEKSNEVQPEAREHCQQEQSPDRNGDAPSQPE